MSNYPTVSGPDPAQIPALALLLEQLQTRYHNAINCVLLYGSCLRGGDIFSGLLDLYLICDDYSSSYGSWRLSFGNWLLPPNVFYAQTEHEGEILRSKVTVISRRDFRRGCSKRWFQSYIWGRFAQPTYIAYARDAKARSAVEACLLDAANTLLNRALPMLPPQGTIHGLWTGALNLSYATELRTERDGRAAELAAAADQFYCTLSEHLADSLAFSFTVYGDNEAPSYRCHVPTHARRWAEISWRLRRAQGKLLSIGRAVKGLFTYQGGLDYVAWKLERHSGEIIVIPDRVRRRPLLYMWGFFWGLYRRGIFK